MSETYRNLNLILGDQLSDRLHAFEDFDSSTDLAWMAEVPGESKSVWSAKPRTALFLSAMRHFAEELRSRDVPLYYHRIGETPEFDSLGEALTAFLDEHEVECVKLTRPGEHRVLAELKACCEKAEVSLELVEDDSFYSTPEDFEAHAEGRKQLRMEYFYREMRKKHDILMDGKDPSGGKWNFDASNRKSFGKSGPERLFTRKRFSPDEITKEVIQMVNTEFADHPGTLDDFDWPVSRKDALEALGSFIENELPKFGTHQDAMWTGEPYLSHSLLASSINLKLLDPREVVDRAAEAFVDGKAPIESVEGFIRQILGWREYVRGIYWLYMPDYIGRNFLKAKEPLPSFFWTGETDMHCLSEVVQQTLKHGYAHHIQRLMVTGLYALLHGVEPKEVHAWYLAVYVDAVEWVELPNTLGMSQYADNGVMAPKPYVATGKYIKRMSNYCDDCRFNPDKRSGEDACPFTVLYWNFLDKHKDTLANNPRMSMQLRNLDRLSPEELESIDESAKSIRAAARS